MSNIRINKPTYEKLTEISEKRKADGKPVKTKQGIVEEAIHNIHKKECGKCTQ